MELIKLKAKQRETSGKGAARRLRQNKVIPGIVYGPKSEPVMLSLDAIEFDKIIRENGSTGLFFNLEIEENFSFIIKTPNQIIIIYSNLRQ